MCCVELQAVLAPRSGRAPLRPPPGCGTPRPYILALHPLPTPSPPLPSPSPPAPQRLLDYIRPDQVHIMQDGRIVRTGDMGLVDQLEESGYAVLKSM